MRYIAVGLMLAVLASCSKDRGDKPLDRGRDAAPRAPAGPRFEVFPSAAAAVQALLARRPKIVGFGEYHATKGGAPVASSLSRFRDEILPAIAGLLGDLVVETWVEPDGCGAKATASAAAVKEAMQRPAETETEVFALLREAKERKITPHILEMSCADYETFRSAGELDYDKPLGIVTARLLAAIDKARAVDTPSTIAVYGGTMHNDVFPIAGFEAYSYAPKVAEPAGAYIEVDLFVPELIAESSLFVGQPWFEVAKREASADHVVLITRGPSSYVVVFRKGVSAKASP